MRRFNTRGFLLALLVVAGAFNAYLLLGSAAYNPDGLRVFPGLHKVFAVSGAEPVYTVQHRFTGYQPTHYFRANVQKHFLFPLYAHVSYDFALSLGYQGSGASIIQVVNALSSAISLALFAALLAATFESAWAVVAATAGLAFSAAFSAMATNIAEVVPAIPWLLLGLLALSAQRSAVSKALTPSPSPNGRGGQGEGFAASLRRGNGRTLLLTVLAGISLGVSTAFYLAGAVVGVALALAFLVRRRPVQALVLFGTMLASAGLIYVAVLYRAGYHSLPAIWRAATFMPEQGTYGGFKATNLVAVVFGYANSLFPILPESFAGLRQLWTALQSTGRSSYLSLAAIPLIGIVSIAFLAALLRVRTRLDPRGRRGLLLGAAVFAGALVASLLWDPYHPKLWIYSNIGLWLAAAAALDQGRGRAGSPTTVVRRPSSVVRRPSFAFTFASSLVILALVAMNLSAMIQRHKSNPRWTAATELAQYVAADHALWDGTNRLVMGGWEPEFDYLTLLLWDTSLVSLPDVYLENGRDVQRFHNVVEGRISEVLGRGGSVYFMNLFNQSPEDLQRSYVDRLRFPEFTSWLDQFRPRVKLVWQDKRTGNDLYEIGDTTATASGP
jgi:hypothetical protein